MADYVWSKKVKVNLINLETNYKHLWKVTCAYWHKCMAKQRFTTEN